MHNHHHPNLDLMDVGLLFPGIPPRPAGVHPAAGVLFNFSSATLFALAKLFAAGVALLPAALHKNIIRVRCLNRATLPKKGHPKIL